jgi:hypothetical protein
VCRQESINALFSEKMHGQNRLLKTIVLMVMGIFTLMRGMKLIMKKIILAIAITSILSACSSTDTFESDDVVIDKINTPIYLRGNFNTWEAQPELELKRVNADVLQTKVKLSTAGETYEFKIADEQWSKGLNCGYLSEDLDQFLESGIPVQANCNSIYNYFSFTPYESGWYQVSINFRQKAKPLVTINQVFE